MYSKWTEEQLRVAVAENVSCRQTILSLGLTDRTTNYKTIQNAINRLGLDTSHWTKRGHRKGKRANNRLSNEQMFVLHEGPSRRGTKLRKRVLEERLIPYICAECNCEPKWQGKELRLHLDHINGNCFDDRLTNLRFLCPNCHDQVETSNKHKVI